MKEKPTRDFKGVWIPREIWEAENLSLIEKCLLTEIDSLDNGMRGCFAGNQYFADFFKIDPRSVRRYISSLEQKGFIHCSSTSSTTRRIVMDKSVRHWRTKMSFNGGQKCPHSNTVNNTENNKHYDLKNLKKPLIKKMTMPRSY